jgi:hypothetical protein
MKPSISYPPTTSPDAAVSGFFHALYVLWAGEGLWGWLGPGSRSCSGSWSGGTP